MIQLQNKQPYPSRSRWKTMLGYCAHFLAFTAAYYTPMFMYGLESSIEDSRIRTLLDTVLANPPTQLAIAKDIGAHFALLGLLFAALMWMADHLAQIVQISRWMARCLILIVGWTFLLSSNAVLFPSSSYTFSFPFLKNAVLAGSLAALFTGGSLFLLLRSRVLRTATLATAIACAGVYTTHSLIPAVHGNVQQNGRNVIIIGVDSLSHAAYERMQDHLPALKALLSQGAYYERAYTPLGRTFPAWISILSGQHPVENGALFNLRNLDKINKQELISTRLQKAGYHTVFSIDERRFNNMDEAFGFDRVIGPSAGALDFVLQQVNDTPLTNLFLQTGLAKSVLGFSYINTQSVPNYNADAFVEATLAAAESDKPLFAAVHFESAHYPFHTRHALQSFNTDNRFWNLHAAALTVVDRQIAQFVEGLKQRGYLNNALVIVLSDHGEALGYTESNLKLDEYPLELRGYGHGARILSDHQNHIILGVTEFRNGTPVYPPAVEKKQVSLLDVSPLIQRYVSGGEAKLQPGSDCLIVETDLRLAEMDDYRTLDPAQVAAGSARFYEIDPQGRMRLKEDQLRDLVEAKDVGWRCTDRVTVRSFFTNDFLTVGLDAQGIPQSIISTPEKDIATINEYRSRLISSVQTQTSP